LVVPELGKTAGLHTNTRNEPAPSLMKVGRGKKNRERTTHSRHFTTQLVPPAGRPF
jgi:hypothetical protein